MARQIVEDNMKNKTGREHDAPNHYIKATWLINFRSIVAAGSALLVLLSMVHRA